METFSIQNTTKQKTNIPFKKIKELILGKKYDLSLVVMGTHLSKRLNEQYKNRKGPTNILSFPISDTEGEIFINIHRASADAKKFGHTPRQHLAYLFIHGCLHLTGEPHGMRMEKLEDKYMQKFARM